MANTGILTTKAIRHIRKIERPRPLRQDSKRSSIIVEGPLVELESLHVNITSGNFDESSFELVQQACINLKKYGAQLETTYKDHLDRYFVSLRNASRDDRLDRLSRLKILEVIEMRAMGWKQSDSISNYYQNKFIELENLLERGPAPATSPTNGLQQSSSSQNILVTLNPGEIIKSSGKFSKATKIPGKNYFKDEVVIRNSDSGKVMGIKGRRVHMIEELSDTIISFQRVAQGVKERLVQITGPHEDAIGSAKHLMEDTIKRNASPVREKKESMFVKSSSVTSLNSNASEDSGTGITNNQNSSYKTSPILHSYSMGDATSVRDYQYTVMVDGEPIHLSGSNLEKVRTAKLVLEEYFAGQAESSGYSSCNHSFSDIGNARRPLSMYANFYKMSKALDHQTGNSEVPNGTSNCVPLQRSKSIPLNTIVSSSSSRSHRLFTDDETCKGESNNAEDEKLQRSNSIDRRDVSTKSNSPPLETNDSLLCSASLRRARFASMSSSTELADKHTEHESPDVCNGCRISYSRNFLLDCSKSPFSTFVPKDLTNIVQDLPYLFKKTTDFFDADAYRAKNFIYDTSNKPKNSSYENHS